MKRLCIKPLCLLVVLAAWVALPAMAGLGYTVTTTVERSDETKHFSEQIITEGDKARIDFMGDDGQADGSYLVTADGGKSFALIDDTEAYCSNWSTEGFFSELARFLKKGERLANAKLKEVSIEKILEEPGGVIAGYDTTHIRVLTKYGANARILFISFEYDIEEIDDIWMTDEFELPVFEDMWLQSTTQSGFDYLDEIFKRRVAFETGPVLRLENRVTLRNMKNGEEEIKKETTLVSNLREISATDIPPGHFDLPECKPVSEKVMKKEAVRMLKKHVR